MGKLKLELDGLASFVNQADIDKFMALAPQCNQSLHEKTGRGNDFLGWVNLPNEITGEQLAEINETANQLRQLADVVVVVGIGGSYLGAKAVIDALSNSFGAHSPSEEGTQVVYAGQNISEDYLFELQDYLSNKNWAIIVISKSGTTTEPALAFRLLKSDLENKFGKKESAKRIVAVTDKSRGALRKLADTEGYKTFVIPDDVGGRFSVLTPVGLLPIAVAGFDVIQLVEGAKEMASDTKPEVAVEENLAAKYAAARNALYSKNITTEIMVNYNPKLHFVAEWWKQLYGESEGKENKGIFPASVDFTSDLHSMGQYIQEGLRNIFETVLSVKTTNHKVLVPSDDDNLDSLNYLAGKNVDDVNKMAELGTKLAHIDGGVPNIRIELEKIDEFSLGQLIYFFEKACGISGYMLDVNPFDQPGVEAYKKNMFALLGKPGFEEATAEIKKRIS
jgi:glucose-6-phosphate isomerase